ncbi:gas vesicle protein [filamentous cyanobacterium CCT1]|nr:gas vesicle protein [filamentous cyanobacterium CCT1]PSN75802.1 gas vesicle protein [filamentous cyanobacterium CCP4]
MSDKQSGGFIGGLMLGAAMGAVAGLLVAPRTGRETRRILKKSADALPELVEDLSTSVHLQADRLSETALVNWEQTLTRLRAAIAAGQEASRQEYEQLSATPIATNSSGQE